jgi:hypothetical protein
MLTCLHSRHTTESPFTFNTLDKRAVNYVIRSGTWILLVTCSFSQYFFCIYQLRIGTKVFEFHNYRSVLFHGIWKLKIASEITFMSMYISNFRRFFIFIIFYLEHKWTRLMLCPLRNTFRKSMNRHGNQLKRQAWSQVIFDLSDKIPENTVL